MDVDIKIDARALTLGDRYLKAMRTVVEDELLDLADLLQRESPEGATGDLKRSWDVQGARRRSLSLTLRGAVKNNASASMARIAGRKPGSFPPFDENSSLGAWVRAKIGGSQAEQRSARYLIARSIARKGTARWRKKENILGIDPTTLKYLPGSPVLRAVDRIEQRLKNLKA